MNFAIVLWVSTSTLIAAGTPYAPLRIGTQPLGNDVGDFYYDTAGSRLANNVTIQTIDYGLIGKPITINTSGKIEKFRYATLEKRYLRKAQGDKTFYIGDMEYKIMNGSATSVFNIRNDAYSPIAQVSMDASANITYNYYVQDHQGTSLVTISDARATQNPKRYDPWGLPVGASGVPLPSDQVDEANRGFTGHEMIKSAGFIHANGRVLDPLVGFVSADPVLFAGNLVSHNPYAYGLNSPLNYVDASGYAPTTYPKGRNLYEWQKYIQLRKSQINPDLTTKDLKKQLSHLRKSGVPLNEEDNFLADAHEHYLNVDNASQRQKRAKLKAAGSKSPDPRTEAGKVYKKARASAFKSLVTAELRSLPNDEKISDAIMSEIRELAGAIGNRARDHFLINAQEKSLKINSVQESVDHVSYQGGVFAFLEERSIEGKPDGVSLYGGEPDIPDGQGRFDGPPPALPPLPPAARDL